jgi:hypothetical protein
MGIVCVWGGYIINNQYVVYVNNYTVAFFRNYIIFMCSKYVTIISAGISEMGLSF